jgi:hypothetical protein
LFIRGGYLFSRRYGMMSLITRAVSLVARELEKPITVREAVAIGSTVGAIIALGLKTITIKIFNVKERKRRDEYEDDEEQEQPFMGM